MSYGGKLVAFSTTFMILMFVFAAWAYAVVRKSHRRWPAVVYSIMLFFSAISFLGVVIMFPIIKSIFERYFNFLNSRCEDIDKIIVQ